MAEATLTARSPLATPGSPGRFGADIAEPGVSIEERHAQMASLAARLGRSADLADAVRTAFGVALPTKPRCVDAGALSFVWSGPDRWLVTRQEHDADADLETELRTRFDALAAITDQGDGRCVLRVGGTRARDALGKLLPIDLHPRAFQPGDAAVTVAAHMGVQVWRPASLAGFEIAVSRSYAASLFHALRDAAAEYGVRIGGT